MMFNKLKIQRTSPAFVKLNKVPVLFGTNKERILLNVQAIFDYFKVKKINKHIKPQ